ncbi:hypothetical protein Gromo_00142 [Candidatus Gromoviella agglomerans]|nr:hypothetical protein Gromo_00142 [Candidatus Gromoviella agglomerans]
MVKYVEYGVINFINGNLECFYNDIVDFLFK